MSVNDIPESIDVCLIRVEEIDVPSVLVRVVVRQIPDELRSQVTQFVALHHKEVTITSTNTHTTDNQIVVYIFTYIHTMEILLSESL